MELKESKLEIDESVIKKMETLLPKDIQEKSMHCTNNFQDSSFCNVEVHTDDEDVTLGCTGNNEIEVSGCNDMYSSSFSGTDSEHENETASNDQEVESAICTDTSLPFPVKKKKVNDHWKKFIHPIMWRCKWIELKIKEFRNQAQMHDKEVEESYRVKQLEFENLKSDEVGGKALPCHTKKTRIRKRKSRKRVEETSDLTSYTANHNILSYHESRKSFAGFIDNSRSLDKRNKSVKDELVLLEEIISSLEFKEGDEFLQQILSKMEAAKSKANNLKNRVDKILSENPSITLDLPESADEKPVISEEKLVESGSVSSQKEALEDDETTDMLLSEIIASRRREVKAKKLKETEQTLVEEVPSRPVRKRTPRNREVMKEETKPKKQRVSREKAKSNVKMTSRFKHPLKRKLKKKRPRRS